MRSITKEVLEAKIENLNAWTDGKFILSNAYGGFRLHRLVENGGETNVFNIGYISAKELAGLIDAFLSGYIFRRQEEKRERAK